MKFANIEKTKLMKKLSSLKADGFTRINSISGVDIGKNIEVIYHFSKEKELVNLKVKVSKIRPILNTITGLYPGAILFEQELSEMLGVKIHGNKFDRLFLPEKWPKGNYPLRKERGKK